MDSPYHKMFSYVLTRIKNFGAWDWITTRMDELRDSVPCTRDVEQNFTLGYENTFSLFFMLGLGLLIAIAYVFLELMYCKLKKSMGHNRRLQTWYRLRGKNTTAGDLEKARRYSIHNIRRNTNHILSHIFDMAFDEEKK